MKILGGEHKGRSFNQPKTRSVRPLSDKVRAALFDVVGEPRGSVVLDAYAGSGAAGFEALSRGAAMVEAIEAATPVARLIEANAKSLSLNWGYMLHVMTVEKWLALPGNQPTGEHPLTRYDLVVADPPYAQLDADVLNRLATFLQAEGVLAVSHSSKLTSPELPAAKLVKHKTYGDTVLSFYQPK